MQKEIKIFSGKSFSVYFSIDTKSSGTYDFRFDFGRDSFTVFYNKYKKDNKVFVSDYLHKNLERSGMLKEEKIAIGWVEKYYNLGLNHIVKNEFGKITLV